MSRLGLHVKTGSRNGYGEVVAEQPSVVVSVGEGGALEEAWEKSGNYTWTIYRTTVYNDNPGMGLDDPATSREDAMKIADYVYPALREEWKENPAHYYIVINESGANDPAVIKNYVAYEWRMMELAEADGYHLCLCNLFSGTPDDGSVAGEEPNGGMETWKELYGPLLHRGYEGGHIYGRHVYGFPDLFPYDPNSERAFREARWLYDAGIYIGIAITECGLDGGQGPVSPARLISQISLFDETILNDVVLSKMIVGFAWWTYGDFTGAIGQANIENHSHSLALYLSENISEPWAPITHKPPQKRYPREIRHTVHLFPQDTTEREQDLATAHLYPTRSAFTFSHDVVEAVMYHSTDDGEIVLWDADRWDFDVEAYLSWLGVKIVHRSFAELEEPEEPPVSEFEYEVWPVTGEPHVTQRWAANPSRYNGFCDSAGLCLPGHDGVDIRAPEGTPVLAVADGRVVRAHADPDTHNYGIHVYIEHMDGELTGYAHLSKMFVEVGDYINFGHVLGESGNTGNSFGAHLHFVRKRPGETYIDEYGVWPWSLHDPTEFLRAVAPDAFAPPALPQFDIYMAMTVDADKGPLYEVQTQYADPGQPDGWGPGPQERHQTQMEDDGTFFHTKGGDGPHKKAQWEQMMADNRTIYRGIDTSPGDDMLYELQDVIGHPWSAWCPRYMAVGERFYRNPQVTYRDKNKCEIVSNQRQESLIVLEAVHDEYEFFTGITLNDVVQLAWLDMAGQVIERYFYAEGFGLVGWGYGTTMRRAAISEIHEPGAREPNEREEICTGV